MPPNQILRLDNIQRQREVTMRLLIESYGILQARVTALETALRVFADAWHWRDSTHGGQIFVDGEQTSGKKLACTALGHPRRSDDWCYCLCGDEYHQALAPGAGGTHG